MKIILFRLRCLLSFAFVMIFAAQARADSTYVVTDLLPLVKSYSLATAINSKGEVTGYTDEDAFVYSNGSVINLGKQFRDVTGVYQWPTHGNDINDLGQVTGFQNNSAYRSFLYANGNISSIVSSAGTNIQAYGINNNGQIVGTMVVPNIDGSGLTQHAFLYSGGVLKDIDNFTLAANSNSYAYGINDSGQVVGISYGVPTRAFQYSNGVMTDIGSLGTFSGVKNCGANAINNNGQITGNCNVADGSHHPFMYSNGSMIDLGALAVLTIPLGMNNKGDIVGYTSGDYTNFRAFLYSNGKLTYLDDLLPPGSGWKLSSAWGINDAGQIVGGGVYSGRTATVRGTSWGQFAFMLNPQPTGNVMLSASNLSLTEGGSSGAYTVTLGSAPSANVTVTISPDKQLSTASAQLTFTPANWNTPQTVSVQAIQDGIAEGNHTGIVSHATASADPAYNALTVGKVTVAISEAVAPTISIAVPTGTVWTQSSLPVTGTAAPGTMVMLTVTNTSTGVTNTFSALADSSGNWNLTLNGLADGSYELQPKAGGISGNKVTVTIDSHAPVSALLINSNNGPNAALWYNGPVTLNVSAVDGAGGQGVARIEYTLDGGATTVFPAAGLTLSNDGSHTFCYRALDTANNAEAWRCASVAIDATSPQVNPVYDAPTGTLNLNAQDTLSGLATVEVSLDGGLTWNAQAGAISFPRDGSYTVQYRARDNAGNLTTGQTSVTVVTAPSITPPANQSASEGAAQSFNLGAFTDAGSDSPWTVDVDWGDGSAHSSFTLASAGTLGAQPHTYADNGSYAVTVKVSDQAGNATSQSFQITVANIAPSAVLSTGAAISEGGTATLAFGNQSDPSSADTQAGFHYAFACDGASLAGATYANSGSNVTTACGYADSGSRPVRARIIDKDDGFTEYTGVVSVSNVPPSATLAVSGPINEGGSAIVTFANPSDPSNTDAQAGFRYAFACDGAALAGATFANSGASASTACVYDDNGVKTIRARIIDKDDGFTEYSASVTVNNVVPSAGFSAGGPINEGNAASLSFSNPIDPSNADVQAGFHYAFACDGAALTGATYANSGSSASASCGFNDNGNRTVRARIIDKDDGFTEYTGVVAVNNSAPSAVLAVTGPINEGGSATVSFSNPADASGTDTLAGFHYAFACDGSSLAAATYANSSASPVTACAYADGPGINAVRARIIDKDDGFTEYVGSVSVNNLAPSVGTITAPTAPVNVNTAVNVAAAFTDPGVQDTHGATIAWGDGSVSAAAISEASGAGSASGSHSYAAAGQYVVTIAVTDKDGASASASYQSIVVINPAGASVTSSGNSKIDSVAGAMPGNPGAAGNVNLQVMANYNGSGALIGNTSFDFNAGNLNFQSTAYDWLIANGSKATIHGTGTINGAGNYGFVVTVIDGGKKGPDWLRMKIWDKGTNVTVYDNQLGVADTADPTTVLSSGKITVK